jgi:hypothetical protein
VNHLLDGPPQSGKPLRFVREADPGSSLLLDFEGPLHLLV